MACRDFEISAVVSILWGMCHVSCSHPEQRTATAQLCRQLQSTGSNEHEIHLNQLIEIEIFHLNGRSPLLLQKSTTFSDIALPQARTGYKPDNV